MTICQLNLPIQVKVSLDWLDQRLNILIFDIFKRKKKIPFKYQQKIWDNLRFCLFRCITVPFMIIQILFKSRLARCDCFNEKYQNSKFHIIIFFEDFQYNVQHWITHPRSHIAFQCNYFIEKLKFFNNEFNTLIFKEYIDDKIHKFQTINSLLLTCSMHHNDNLPNHIHNCMLLKLCNFHCKQLKKKWKK